MISTALLLGGYLWAGIDPIDRTVEARFAPPPGYARLATPPDGFGAWLRGLPVKPGRPPVRLFSGELKGNQSAHLGVIDIDVGSKDLQQCADAVIRLRAEYLFSAGRAEAIAFHFTSGHVARFAEWARGLRPVVSGSSVRWSPHGARDPSYASFRAYLETVFLYAGSKSLADELRPVRVTEIQPGDVFVQGGFPGHAVVVLDVAADREDRRVFLLAQSYMPAQEIHVLRRPSTEQPWFEARPREPLVTPEWVFPPDSLRRFP